MIGCGQTQVQSTYAFRNRRGRSGEAGTGQRPRQRRSLERLHLKRRDDRKWQLWHKLRQVKGAMGVAGGDMSSCGGGATVGCGQGTAVRPMMGTTRRGDRPGRRSEAGPMAGSRAPAPVRLEGRTCGGRACISPAGSLSL